MLLSQEDKSNEDFHPYWYARVVGIFHADVEYRPPGTMHRSKVEQMEFLWIRWFAQEKDYKAGWTARRLHRVGFLDATEDGAFAFLDPVEVIRGIHMIPAFAQGTTKGCLGPSVAREPLSELPDDEDWQFYYINM